MLVHNYAFEVCQSADVYYIIGLAMNNCLK